MLLSVSCVREETAAIDRFEKEGATVPVIFSFQEPVVLQASTKAEIGMEMGEEPAISSMHIAIFGTDRYLKDYVSAYPCDVDGNPLAGGFASQNATSAYFLARLPISSKERVLHIIANGPSTLPFNAYENDIMQNMTVSDGNGAYWQRVVLPGGIRVVETDGNPEQTPEGEYIPTAATTAAVSNLTLIRNFASITVSENAANFEIVSYTLCNMPRSGAIAMYSTNHGDWVPGYTDPATTLSQYRYSYEDPDDNVVKTYLGFPTDPDIDTNVPTTVDALNAPGVSVAADTPIYVYERAVTTDNPPFILMAARYVSSGTPTSATPIHYYRLDLALESGYFPIYRNYRYGINISEVSVDGFDDPADAAAHNSGSNFSVSMDTRTLPDVSNGIVRLFIEKPNFDWVYNTDTQKFWYKFVLNSASSGDLNGSVTVTEKEGNAISSLTVDSVDSANEHRFVNYTLNEPNGTSTLSSTLQLVGTYTDGSDTYRLVRLVTIRVFNAKEIHPSLSPATVADEGGQLTTLSIPLPWDLQSSMFPMEILIEDSAKALNPASGENMPVKTTGVDNPDEAFKSLSGSNESSYCFVRTLNWSEYQRLKNNAELSGSDDIILTCDFETTKSFSSSTVYVYNKYFATNSSGVTTAQTTLTGDPDNNITPNRQNVSGTAATVKVKSTGNWELSISLANGGVASGTSLSPSSGSSTSGQDVTVTLPENVTENAIRYLVTLRNISVNPNLVRTAYITQEGIMMKLSSTVTSVDNDSNSVTVTVESGTSYVLEVIDPDGNVLSTSSEYSPTTGPTDHQVIIPQNTTIHERNFTIRVRNTISTVWEDITIKQAAGVAKLTLVEDEIRMSDTEATINVTSSFDTVLKAYIQGNDVPVYTDNIGATTGQDETITGIPVNNTGADRTIRVNLCDTSGAVLDSKTITQLGAPYIKITTSDGSIGSTVTSATLNVDSEAAWTLALSGGLSGASLSAASGPAGSTNAVTLTVPVNNTLTAQTYTISGDNGYHNSSVTVTQAAGTASLSPVGSNVWMTATSATVNVSSSFASVLKVYLPGDTDPVSTKDVAAGAAHNETVTLTANTTGVDRTVRVDLCNSDGAVVATVNLTQAGTPSFELTATATSVIGNATTTTLHLASELPCDLTVEGSGSPTVSTPLGITGVVTDPSGTTITLTMPVNYTTSDVTYTVKASRSGYADESVAITHRKATLRTGQTVTFNTTSGAAAAYRYSTGNNQSVTMNGITGTFSNVNAVGGTYMTLNNGTTMSMSVDNTLVYEITSVVMTFSVNNRSPLQANSSTTAGSLSCGTTTTWTGNSASFSMTLSRNNNNLRMTQYVVTYTDYQWN